MTREPASVSTLPVTLSAIQDARGRIVNVAYRTPLYFSPNLSTLTNSIVYLKLECYQPIRVFKIRGAANKILKLSAEERKRGLVAASSGNHGLAVSYIARQLGIEATIVVPTNAVEEKVNGIEEYGAKVVKHGLFHDERAGKALEIQKRSGAVLIHPFDDADVIAGQGTIGVEICEDLPDVNTVIVPIGGGGLIAGISTAIKSLRPAARVLGVEPERASSMYQSIKNGKITELTDTTSIADGLATREPGVLTFDIVQANVDEILLVSEEQIERAVFTAMKQCHLVIEPSAAAAIAALIEKAQVKTGEKIAVVVSGGNISLQTLANILSKYG
jgi:threonine dehydratase